MIAIMLAHSIVLLSLAFMLWKREPSPIRKFFWPALFAKLAAGIVLGLVYTYYYPIGDTFNYFEDGRRLARFARTDFSAYVNFIWDSSGAAAIRDQLIFQPRVLFFSKITSVVCLISGGNYWIISLYFSFISFCGAWFLFRIIARLYPLLQDAALLALLFFPSVVFWTSGLIKESLAMAAMYYIVGIFLKFWAAEKIRLVQWLFLPVCLWSLWSLKYYYLAVLLPVLFTALVFKLLIYPRVVFRSWALEFLTWAVVFLLPLFIISQARPNFYPARFLEVIVSNYTDFVELSEPQDVILYEDLHADVVSVLRYAPKALFSGLFRPFIWEAENIFQRLVAFENVALLLLLLTSLPRWKMLVRSPDRMLILSGVVYVVLLGVFLALSTPNFGTLARYRVGFLPIFILLTAGDNTFLLQIKSFVQRRFSSLVRERT
jgi:hypothetical protein